MRRRYDIPAFARHLTTLSEPGRGNVLQKAGVARRFRYRFVNPLLAPFVIMRGLDGGLVSDQQLKDLTEA